MNGRSLKPRTHPIPERLAGSHEGYEARIGRRLVGVAVIVLLDRIQPLESITRGKSDYVRLLFRP